MSEPIIEQNIKIKRFVVERVIEDTNHLHVPSFRPDSPIPRSGSLSLSVHFSSEEEIIPLNFKYTVSIFYTFIIRVLLD